MNTQEILKQKLEEIKRLAQEAEQLASALTSSNDYNTDQDFLGKTQFDCSEIWSIANRNVELIDRKVEYDKELPWS